MRELKVSFTDIEDVRGALQDAIGLEFATIPPYLYALWSIKDSRCRAAELIGGVVAEEMLHLALVANVLNAIGGRPRFTGAETVPSYPGPLPGGVHQGLKVSLRPCDRDQLEVFKRIEYPENPVDVQSLAKATGPVTIGQFYDALAGTLHEMGPAAFTGDPGRQVRSWPSAGEIRNIDGPDAAQWAIRLIKEQGEGASAHDPNDRDGELGHYYRFWEILEGREITLRDDGWAFAGAPIAMPEVHPLVSNPQLGDLVEGSRALAISTQWNATYSALLNALERTFNGHPQYLVQSIGVMYALRTQALELFKHVSGRGDGTVAGPTFQPAQLGLRAPGSR